MMASRFILPQTSPCSSSYVLNNNLTQLRHCHRYLGPLLFVDNHLVALPTFCARGAHLGAQCTSVGNGTPSSRMGEIEKVFPTTMVDVEDFPAGLRRENMPRHVAFILDGNRRWAEHRGLGSDYGHAAGLKALLNIMSICANLGVNVATFFLFSSENWCRPKARNANFHDWRRIKAPEFLTRSDRTHKKVTQDNTKTHVIFAISYSGKNDFVQACQSLATKVKNGLVEPSDITESVIEHELETKIISGYPCPDVLIRTSGEVRISNFLLWQLAYSEMYFKNTRWPDFGEPEFVEALLSFQKRGRRFGGQ